MPPTPYERSVKRHYDNVKLAEIDFLHKPPGRITFEMLDGLSYMELDTLMLHTKAMIKLHKKRDALKLETPVYVEADAKSEPAPEPVPEPVLEPVLEPAPTVTSEEFKRLESMSIDNLVEEVDKMQREFADEFCMETAWKNRTKAKRPDYVKLLNDAHEELTRFTRVALTAGFNRLSDKPKIKHRLLDAEELREEYIEKLMEFENPSKVDKVVKSEPKVSKSSKKELSQSEKDMNHLITRLNLIDNEFRNAGNDDMRAAIKKEMDELMVKFMPLFTTKDMHQQLKLKMLILNRDFDNAM